MFKTIKNYGFIGTIRLILNVIYSIIFVSRHIRIISLSFYVRVIGYINWSENFTSVVNIRIDVFPQKENISQYLLEIGENTSILPYSKHL